MNDNTIDYYNDFKNDYAAQTVNADMSYAYSMFQRYLPSCAKVLDAGCGSGRDSLYFIQKGYEVTAIDASQYMCESASKFIKQPVLCKTFQEIEYNQYFDGVWACASLLHVNTVEIVSVMTKVITSIVNGGVLYASWKYGKGERIEETTGRYFCDMNESGIQRIVSSLPGTYISELWISDDVRSEYAAQKWLNVIIKKN